MASTPAPKPGEPRQPESGVALFMVIASLSILSILVTEFAYIASMNQTVAFDGLDQLKAHYLAKSGLKLSLLRLKAYQQVKGAIGALGGGGSGAGGAGAIPKQVLDKIWSFPFFYPIPSDLPGMSIAQKDALSKFEKSSNLQGKFSAIIDSESAKFNLNSIFARFSAPSPTPSASPGAPPPPPPPPGQRPDQPNPTPSAQAFSPEQARDSLREYFAQIMNNKIENDQEFADEYRDWKLEDFLDNLFAWTDRTYERKTTVPNDVMTFKGAPFNSVNELRMIPGMDDKLFDLFSPALTASATPGININTMQAPTLRALVPGIKPEEVDEFFKFRDDDTVDNTFKSPDDFFAYLPKGVESFSRGSNSVEKLKGELNKRGIRLVIDESEFKITVKATVNQSTRTFEAWVTLIDSSKGKTGAGGNPGQGQNQPPNPNQGQPTPTDLGTASRPDPGLRITFMRVL
jgi:type II secretory pathway component PulK